VKNSNTGLEVGLAQYGTVLVQWYVVHSHERRLAEGMIDDEVKVCLNFYSHACLQNAAPVEGTGAGLPASPMSQGRKRRKNLPWACGPIMNKGKWRAFDVRKKVLNDWIVIIHISSLHMYCTFSRANDEQVSKDLWRHTIGAHRRLVLD
jgi:hypothetical protein